MFRFVPRRGGVAARAFGGSSGRPGRLRLERADRSRRAVDAAARLAVPGLADGQGNGRWQGDVFRRRRAGPGHEVVRPAAGRPRSQSCPTWSSATGRSISTPQATTICCSSTTRSTRPTSMRCDFGTSAPTGSRMPWRWTSPRSSRTARSPTPCPPPVAAGTRAPAEPHAVCPARLQDDRDPLVRQGRSGAGPPA